MGYRQSPDIEYGDFEDLDAFGRLKSSNSTLIWNGGSIFPGGFGGWTDMVYGFDPISAEIVFTDSAIELQKTAQPLSSPITVWIESPYHLPANVGRSNLCIFSFSEFSLATLDHQKNIGLFHRKCDAADAKTIIRDGYYFSSYNKDGSQEYAFIIAENGVETQVINQGDWLTFDMDPTLIDFGKSPQTGWISLDNSVYEKRIRAGFIVNGIPKKFIDVPYVRESQLDSPIVNQKFRMELTYTTDTSTPDNFIALHQSYSIEETETETGKFFSSYVTGVTGPVAASLLKSTEVLSFKLPLGQFAPLEWSFDPPGPYWSFAELDSISVTSDSKNPTWIHLVSRPDTVRPGLTFNPLNSFNINNAGGTYSSPIWYSTDKGDLDISNTVNKSTIISSYLVDSFTSLNIKIDPGLCRLGYVILGISGNGPSAQSSVISVCISSTKDSTTHTITANWRCIT
jgi:hypothetical protein